MSETGRHQSSFQQVKFWSIRENTLGNKSHPLNPPPRKKKVSKPRTKSPSTSRNSKELTVFLGFLFYDRGEKSFPYVHRTPIHIPLSSRGHPAEKRGRDERPPLNVPTANHAVGTFYFECACCLSHQGGKSAATNRAADERRERLFTRRHEITTIRSISCRRVDTFRLL